MPNPAVTSDPSREIVTERIVNAPRALVWKAWTDPAHLIHWWGPNGFTHTFHEIEIRPGGEWKFIMHGPDGVNYPNYIKFEEIKRPERITYVHGERANDPSFFRSIVTFEEVGTTTKVTLRAILQSKEAKDFVIKQFKADIGAEQHLNRMAARLETMPRAEANELALTRVFNAPVDLVWRAWTEPEHFQKWWGPASFTCPFCEMDVRPGGAFRWAMRWPDGRDNWTGGRFTEVVPKTRLAFIQWFTDADGRKVHPSVYDMPGDWPGDEMPCVVEFTALGDRTQMVLRHAGLPEFMLADAGAGWSTSLDKMAASFKAGGAA